MIISPILFVGLVAGLQVEEWNIDNLEIQDWEVSFPSPFPTPFKDHPRNTEAPTFSAQPTLNPTDAPSLYPTLNPSLQPSSFPSSNPSFAPSIGSPTVDPTLSPTSPPSLCPSFKPSPYPTLFPSLPGHIGSPSPTPYPTSPQQSLELEYVLGMKFLLTNFDRYILFGTIVTLGDMMVIAATIWSAIVFMLVAFFQRFLNLLLASLLTTTGEEFLGPRVHRSSLMQTIQRIPISLRVQLHTLQVGLAKIWCVFLSVSTLCLTFSSHLLVATRPQLPRYYRQHLFPNRLGQLSLFHQTSPHHHYHFLMKKMITFPSDCRPA